MESKSSDIALRSKFHKNVSVYKGEFNENETSTLCLMQNVNKQVRVLLPFRWLLRSDWLKVVTLRNSNCDVTSKSS